MQVLGIFRLKMAQGPKAFRRFAALAVRGAASLQATLVIMIQDPSVLYFGTCPVDAHALLGVMKALRLPIA